MKSTAKNILSKRDNLSNEISKYWNIIYVENVVNHNYKRNYDLKALYETILDLAEQRSLTKFKALCINMGIFKFSEVPMDNIQLDIFRLAEMKEIKVKLGKIRTINPKLKAAKGKKALNKTEVLTSNWIKARIKDIDLKITEIEKKISDFNESHELDEEKAPMSLAA